MKIREISINKSYPNFGAVYKAGEIKFTPKQNKVVDDILTKLRSRLKQFNNKTAEEYYESKKIDFSIENDNQNAGSVSLMGYFNAKEKRNKNNLFITYSKAFQVGVYNSSYKFNINDIEERIKQEKKSIGQTKAILMVPVIGLAALLGIEIKNQRNLSGAESEKNQAAVSLVETVDSTASEMSGNVSDNANFFETVKE